MRELRLPPRMPKLSMRVVPLRWWALSGNRCDFHIYSRFDGRRNRKMPPYNVKAEWDEEAGVWVASSDEVPGLATGADTFEALIEKLRAVIPELLEENGL